MFWSCKVTKKKLLCGTTPDFTFPFSLGHIVVTQLKKQEIAIMKTMMNIKKVI